MQFHKNVSKENNSEQKENPVNKSKDRGVTKNEKQQC